MGDIFIGIMVVLVIVVLVVIILVLKNYKSDKRLEKVKGTEEKALQVTTLDSERQDIVIQMEMLPIEFIQDEKRLVEISDSRVLAHINNLVPEFAQVGNVVNNAVQAVQDNGEVLYRAIIPVGAKLTDSKAMEGAVRGIYHGADGIRGHANLVAVEMQKGTSIVGNTIAAAMGVASMVVGQYYMTQINTELGEISDGISKISDFQDNEYRSRVFSLVTHVKKISDFQIEILENDELRFSKISQLDSLEEECTQLLGQANLTLAGYTKKTDCDYFTYEKVLLEIQNWYMYQRSLLDILYRISELRYALHLGAISREQCIALLSTYSNQVSETRSRLASWHQTNIERLKINMSEMRRKRVGFDRVIHSIPGVFNDSFNFKTIEKSTVDMIELQSSNSENVLEYDTSELYEDDVQLIYKNGKMYYLLAEDICVNARI